MAVEQPDSRSNSNGARSIASAVAVINPVSGAGLDRAAAAMRAGFVRDRLGRAGVPLTVHVTERSGHAREIAAAAAAQGTDLLIVWGGDGTVNEAGAALVGTKTALGLVPAGSGNGLASALDAPRDPSRALDRMLSRAPRAVDVGILDGRPFFNIAGIGIDACIAGQFNARRRGRRGRWPYLLIGIREGWRYRAREYEVELDGRRSRVSALLIAFANGQEYGMGASLSPQAKLDDGWLDATIVEDRSILARFVDARHLMTRSLHGLRGVHATQVRQARVTTHGVLPYHVDGEPGSVHGGVDISLIRGGLWVRA